MVACGCNGNAIMHAVYFVIALSTSSIQIADGYRYRFIRTMRPSFIPVSLTSSGTNALRERGVAETSPAEMVAMASSHWDVLKVAEHLVLPGEETLHYQKQLVHQRKRCSAAANALKRLSKFLVGVSVTADKIRVLQDDKFRRICLAATAPLIEEKQQQLQPQSTVDFSSSEFPVPVGHSREDLFRSLTEKSDLSNYVEVIRVLGVLGPLNEDITLDIIYPTIASLCSFLPVPQHQHQHGSSGSTGSSISSRQQSSLSLTSQETMRLEWAYRRLTIPNRPALASSPSSPSSSQSPSPPSFATALSAAAESQNLPFRVLHGLTKGLVDVVEARKTIPFRSEKLQTRDGRVVAERRETCWMADPGVGGLAYSGKIMEPVPFSESVARVRDAIEEKTGHYFDCCLINWYDDGDCACKFHSDPDHGRLWSVDAMVVSIGETRRFHLRKIPERERGTPQQYGSYGASGAAAARGVRTNAQQKRIGETTTAAEKTTEKKQETEQDHYTYHVYDGDVFYMFDDCQDSYQHCIMKSESESNNSPRASIVFKKSIPGPGGKRGHGLPKQPTMTTTNTAGGAVGKQTGNSDRSTNNSNNNSGATRSRSPATSSIATAGSKNKSAGGPGSGSGSSGLGPSGTTNGRSSTKSLNSGSSTQGTSNGSGASRTPTRGADGSITSSSRHNGSSSSRGSSTGGSRGGGNKQR